MGRKSKNITYEQMLKSGRIRAKEYYEKNKEKCRQKALERYHRIKNQNLE
jgi:hypothetical protein